MGGQTLAPANVHYAAEIPYLSAALGHTSLSNSLSASQFARVYITKVDKPSQEGFSRSLPGDVGRVNLDHVLGQSQSGRARFVCLETASQFVKRP
jgi:hypothetical protein